MFPSATRLQNVAKNITRAPKARVARTPPPPPAKGAPRAPTAPSRPPTLQQPPPPSAPSRAPPRPSGTSPKETVQTPKSSISWHTYRALPWALLSIMGGVIGFYSVQLYIASGKPCTNPNVLSLKGQKDVSARYEETADSFDSEVGISEILMGVNRLRKKLAREAWGDVLEASCGTGRNLGYFDVGGQGVGKVRSLTFVDLSPAMVEVCKRKWIALKGKDAGKIPVRFVTGSVIGAVPPAPGTEGRGKYNTVIQTMGLCSTPEPVSLLVNLVAHLDTSNAESRILLLEHGRSHRDWLNRIMDNSAEKHAEVHGCWYNRDIGALVAEAAKQTGMVVTTERRKHFGTTWVYELRPGEELVRRSRAGPAIAKGGAVFGQGSDQSWSGWLGSRLGWK